MTARSRAHVLRLRPSSHRPLLDPAELWEYRELLYFLTWRDIKVRYKQTALGGAWAVLQPLLTMAVFSTVFGGLAKVPSDGTPYPLYTYAALLPWQLFAYALTQSSQSLIADQRLITKVYFPRVIAPLSSVLGALLDFAVAFAMLLVLMAYYRTAPSPAIWALPIFLGLSVVASVALGLWLSALNVKYRDVRYVVPFLTQVLMFVTPIAYPTSMIPARWRPLYALNPMAGAVDGFRWCLFGVPSPLGPWLAASFASAALLAVTGWAYFRETERTFADVI